MRENKKVWLSFPNYSAKIKGYVIEINIPGLHDVLALQENEVKYTSYEENPELGERNKVLGAYNLNIVNFIQGFEKFPVLPDGLWLPWNSDEHPKASEYIFTIRGGGIVLNEACANIFQQFRLGESTLTPVKIHKGLSRELWRDDTYYFLNMCEKRSFVCKQQRETEKLKYFEFSPDKWRYTNKFTQNYVDYVDVERAAVDCDIDLWHDPRLVYRSYFMSDDLYQALRQAGFAKAWAAGECRLV